MTFAALASKSTVFLDANVFVYALSAHPQYGTTNQLLLQRVQQQDVIGFTATHILSEVAHRLMTLEAVNRLGWPLTGIGNRLRHSPSAVQSLTDFRQAVHDVLQMPITVLVISPAQVLMAADLSRQFGMLSNDALTVVLMQANGLSQIASLDGDFDRVPGFVRFSPV